MTPAAPAPAKEIYADWAESAEAGLPIADHSVTLGIRAQGAHS